MTCMINAASNFLPKEKNKPFSENKKRKNLFFDYKMEMKMKSKNPENKTTKGSR